MSKKDWEETAYIIMWQSPKSGGTYTELRKTRRGLDRFLDTLKFLGFDMSKVHVFEQPKLWAPDRINGQLEKGRDKNVRTIVRTRQTLLLP